MTAEILGGLTLGLAAGIAPGPLQALIVTATLHRGFSAGWRVAVAPLLTDALVIAVTVGLLTVVPDRVLVGLTVAGGLVVAGVGVAEIRRARAPFPAATVAAGEARDLWRGVVVNVTNPHVWIFWLLAGGPLLVRLQRTSPPAAAGFLAVFYAGLVGTKVGLAGAVAVLRRRLPERWRRHLVAGGGLLLVAGGILLVVTAIR